ncbi:MAG: hypothetical protein PHQ67_03990 [Fermentimonas sp.]|nr:hypothetical protein [Fermentimonas sp.]MDD4804727.1 hypothetical protein [Candidatus Paceibacterota bacterium]
MENKELESVYGLLCIVKERLTKDSGDIMARGMVDELIDQYRESEDPQAVEIVGHLRKIRVMLTFIDLKEMV